MQRCWTKVMSVVSAMALMTGAASAQDKKPTGPIQPAEVKLGRPVDFEKDVFPILDAKCIACHNVAISENGLILEDVKAILKGGKRGPSVVPKEPDKSSLYTLAARGKNPAMPPLPNKVEATALTPQELGILRQWILEGATAGMGSGGKTVQWQPIPKNFYPIYSVAVTADGQYAACGRANQIVIYHIPSGEQVAQLSDPSLLSFQFNGKPMYDNTAAHRDFVHSLAFSPNGRMLASGGFREVKLWTRPEPTETLKLAGTGAVSAVTVSPDEKWIATTSADNSVKLFNVADGKPGKPLTGHTAAVTGVQFSPDSTKVVTCSQDKTLRVWTVADGKEVVKWEAPAELTALALNADGTKVIAGSSDKLARVWTIPAADAKPEDIKVEVTLTGHTGPVTGVALITPAGTQVVTGSEDGSVRVWDLAKGTMVRSLAHGAAVTSVAVSPDGARIASAGANNLAILWTADKGTKVVEMKGDLRNVRTVARLTADEAEAKANATAATNAVPTAEKAVKDREEAVKKAMEAKATAEKAFAEADTKAKDAMKAQEAAKKTAEEKKDDKDAAKALEKATKDATDTAAAAKKASDDKTKAVDALTQAEKGVVSANEAVVKAKAASEAATAKHKDVEAKLAAAKTAAGEREKPVRVVRFSKDGKELATSGDLPFVATWDGVTGAPLEVFDAHGGPVSGLTYLSGKRLVSGSADQSAKIWELSPAWKLAGTLGPKKETPQDVSTSAFVSRVLSLDFNPEGTMLATGGGDPSRTGEVIIWDPVKQTVIKSLPEAHSDTVYGMQFSRDSSLLVTGAADKFVKVFDVASGKHVKSFEGHTNHVLDVSIRGDAKQIASAGADNVIKIWNMETGEQERTIQGYAKQVTSIQYSGRSANIVSCGGDKTVRMHTATNGGNVRTYTGPADFMFAVAVSENEQIVVAGGQDGILRVWAAGAAAVIKQFDPPKAPETAQATTATK